jgi:hypothetical protein
MALYESLLANQVRVLILDPASDRGHPITCTLKTISLGNPTSSGFTPLPFEALSYVWGSPAVTSEITVNGHVQTVRVNLVKALRGLRRRGKMSKVRKGGLREKVLNSVWSSKQKQEEQRVKRSRTFDHHDWSKEQLDDFGDLAAILDSDDGRRVLWIDAICINQKDNKERTVQVRLLSRIYRNAARVVVWLGEGDAEIDRTVEWMKDNVEDVEELKDLNLRELTLFGKKRSKATEKETHDGLQKLIQNEYWHRMWTAQEFGLAHSDPLLIAGTSSFEARYLWPALRSKGMLQDMSSILQSENKHVQNSYSSKFSSLQTSLLIRHALKRPGEVPYEIKPSLGLFLPLTWARRCEDSKDKIFALYAIVAPTGLEAPDYDKTHTAVMSEAMAYIINVERDYDLLCYHAMDQESKPYFADESQRHPSWLPDLFDGGLDSPRCPARYMTRHISSKGGLQLGERPVISSDLRFLVLNGVYVDRVRRILPLTDSKTGDVWARITEFCELVEENEQRVRRDLPLPENSSLGTVIRQRGLQSRWETLAPAFETEEESEGTEKIAEKRKVLEQLFNDFASDQKGGKLKRYLERFVFKRHLFLTTHGLHGLCSPDVKEGDELYLVSGIKLPFILRRVNLGAEVKYFRMICGANVSGIMMGELNDEIKKTEELVVV